MNNAYYFFQGNNDNSCGPHLSKYCVAHIEKILVSSPSEGQHKIDLEEVLLL